MNTGTPKTDSGRDGARRELILYATPTGPLAEQCAAYFVAVDKKLDPTTAQTYPPHCTLTGFFRRTDLGTARAIAEIEPIITAAGPVPNRAVTVVTLRTTQSWVGLELQSAWLSELADSVAAQHTLEPGDDALRIKDWLHLSLAYGRTLDGPEKPLDLGPYAELAEAMVDPTAPCGWEVGLWERTPGHWIRHGQHSSAAEVSN